MIGARALLLFLLAPTASASSTVGPLLDRVDLDRDAAVSARELRRFRAGLGAPLDRRDAVALVGRFDADHTGTLGLDELRAWVDATRGPPDQDERDRMFGLVDDDGDERARPREVGAIVAAYELTRGDLERLVALYDADGDGALDRAEFARLHEDASLRSTMSPDVLAVPPDPFDPTGDGLVSRGEFAHVLALVGVTGPEARDVTEAWFLRWDGDGDGVVSADEAPKS